MKIMLCYTNKHDGDIYVPTLSQKVPHDAVNQLTSLFLVRG